MKRVLAWLFAVMTALALGTGVAFAAEPQNAAGPQTVVGAPTDLTANAGDTIEIPVSITGVPAEGVAGLTFKFSVTGIEGAEITGFPKPSNSVLTGGMTIGQREGKLTNIVVVAEAYDIMPSGDGVIWNVQVKIPENAPSGTLTLGIEVRDLLDNHPDIRDIPHTVVPGKVAVRGTTVTPPAPTYPAITITVYESDGTTVEKTVTMTGTDVASALAELESGRSTLYGQYLKNGSFTAYKTDTYLTVQDLFDFAQITPADGDTLKLGNKWSATWANAKAGMYYPNAVDANTLGENGFTVAPALAFAGEWASGTTMAQLGNYAAIETECLPMGMVGISEANGNGGNRYWTGLTEIVLVREETQVTPPEPPAPPALTEVTITASVASKTHDTVVASATVNPASEGQVRYLLKDTNVAPAVDDAAWQTSTTFTGLTPEATYYLFAQVAATATTKAAMSAGVAVTTNAAPAPPAPEGTYVIDVRDNVGSVNADSLAAAANAAATANNANTRLTIIVTGGAASDADKALVEGQLTQKNNVVFVNTMLMALVEGQPAAIDYGSANTELIAVTYDFNFTGKSGIRVFQVHNGVLAELGTTANANGEYYVADTTNNTITVYAKKYSTYAFAYTTEAGTVTPNEPNKPNKPQIPNTGDGAGMPLALCLMAAGIAVLAGVAARRKSMQ